jgi:hypothetical protein
LIFELVLRAAVENENLCETFTLSKRRSHMSAKKRMIIGALGGITPYILSILVIDFQTTLHDFDLFDGIGLLSRCLVLVFLGSLVAYFHKSETDDFKLFQLGIAAPALLATWINGYSSSQPVMQPVTRVVIEQETGSNTFKPGLLQLMETIAYAQESQTGQGSPTAQSIKNDSYLRDLEISTSDRLLRGLIGKKISNTNTHYVIVGSYRNEEDANREIELLKEKNYRAVLLPSFKDSQFFGVAIGTNLTFEEAKELQNLAKQDGLSKDTFIWSH